MEGALDEILARLEELDVDDLLRVLEGVTAELRRKMNTAPSAAIAESEDTPEEIVAEIRAERFEQEREP